MERRAQPCTSPPRAPPSKADPAPGPASVRNPAGRAEQPRLDRRESPAKAQGRPRRHHRPSPHGRRHASRDVAPHDIPLGGHAAPPKTNQFQAPGDRTAHFLVLPLQRGGKGENAHFGPDVSVTIAVLEGLRVPLELCRFGGAACPLRTRGGLGAGRRRRGRRRRPPARCNRASRRR